MAQFSIAALWIYPVKSLGGMPLDTVMITEAGSLAGDREWIVVRPDGRMLWQGDIPGMTLLTARIVADQLILTAPGGASLALPYADAGPAQSILQYGYTIDGVDAGNDAAAWLSDHLQAACRLVRIGPEAHRWAGLNPVHALSLNSLRVLNERLAEQGDQPVEAERFRPNVILGGDHAAFAEEAVPQIMFPDAQLMLREPCIRCELPNISRRDANRSRQPLKLIGSMAKSRPTAKPASFGIYAIASGAELRVGMNSQGPTISGGGPGKRL